VLNADGSDPCHQVGWDAGRYVLGLPQRRIQDEDVNPPRKPFFEESLAFSKSLPQIEEMLFGSGVNNKRVIFVCWLVVALSYFYLSYDYIRVSWNGQRFAEYVQFVVQLAGSENRPPNDVVQLLLVKAEELGFPLERRQILVTGSGPSLSVTVKYAVDVDLPVLRRGFYYKQFEHTARYKRQV
jgi:hypothetical protein